MRIELINETGRPMEIIDDGYQTSATEITQRIILADLQRNGQISQGISRRFGVTPR